jgi:hypothetical protein
MQYMLLIYGNEADWEAQAPEAISAVMGEYQAFTEGVIADGRHRGGHELKPVSTATTVRVKDGEILVTDGPFAETREQLGGYYLVEAADLDEAIALAARIPSARMGCIEVRPVVVRD